MAPTYAATKENSDMMVSNPHFNTRLRSRIGNASFALLLALAPPVAGQHLVRNVKVNEADPNDASPEINNARTQSEVSLAAWTNPSNPTESVIVVGWNDTRDRALGWPYSSLADWARSTDGGLTWEDMATPPLTDIVAIRGDPVLLADSAGLFYFVQLVELQVSQTPPTFRLRVGVFRSTPDVRAWEPATVVPPPSISDADKPWGVIGLYFPPNAPPQERLYVAYYQGGSIYLSYATLGAPTVDFATVFIDTVTLDSVTQGPYVDADSNGDVYVAWNKFSPPRRIRVARLSYNASGQLEIVHTTDLHGTGDPPVPALDYVGDCRFPCTAGYQFCPQHLAYDGQIRANQHPRLRVHRANDNVYLTWTVDPDGSGIFPCTCGGGPDEATVMFARSTDNGLHWEAHRDLVAMASGEAGDLADQWDPAISLAPPAPTRPSGVLCIMWNDKRNDAVNNFAFDLYYTLSGDGGVTFTPAKRVTKLIGGGAAESLPSPVPQPLCGQIEERYDPWIRPGYMGDYNQVIYHDDCFLFSWSDNRFEFDRIVPGEGSLPTPDPDVYFAKRRAVLLYGDFDFDCDVDLTDYIHFQQCFGGEGNQVGSECLDADFDCEGDVDLADYEAFSENFTGSGSGCGSEGGNAAMGDPPPPEALDRAVIWTRTAVPHSLRSDVALNLEALARNHADPEYARLLEEFAARIR